MNYSIGIDVGKEEMVACIRGSDGLAAPTISFPNTTVGTKRFLRQLAARSIPEETPILLESTGPYHWHTARLLAEYARNVRVVNPILTRRIIRHSIRKVKTDAVDAGHLAFLASQGYGHPFRDTEILAYRKALIRHYWKLTAMMTNCKLHERYLAVYRGIVRAPLAPLLARRRTALKTEILSLFRKGNDLRYLDSIPGVTPLLAATILAELQPLDRFSRIEEVVAYAGLDPGVKQSGGKPARYRKLSKRGSPTLRKALFFAAFGSFSRDPFCGYYRAYRQRGLHHTTALTMISRKILRIAFALLKKRELFNRQYLDGT